MKNMPDVTCDNLLARSGLSREQREMVCSVTEDLKQYGYVLAVMLYGSYASGRAKCYSDIDIAVITWNISTRMQREEIGSYASNVVDIQLFSDLPLPAQFSLLNVHIPLFIRDTNQLRTLSKQVILSYLDLEPMRTRWKKRLIGGTNEFYR